NASRDQSWRDERHRYRHVDVTNAAFLSFSDIFDTRRARDDLAEPGTTARNGLEQRRATLDFDRSDARSFCHGGQQELLEPLRRRLGPWAQQRGLMRTGRKSGSFIDRRGGRWLEPDGQLVGAHLDAFDPGEDVVLVG